MIRPSMHVLVRAAAVMHIAAACLADDAPAFVPLEYDVRLETVVAYNGDDWMWFHPRVAAVPDAGDNGGPAVVMTLQRHLNISDYYSGLYAMRTNDLGKTWTEPKEIPELAWQTGPDGETIAVCDVTPGWHAPTGKIIAIGIQLRYGARGQQLEDKPGSYKAAYTVHDPGAGTWTPWRTIDFPDSDSRFWAVAPGCVQWHVEQDGSILLPFYFRGPDTQVYSVMVARCVFDGSTLRVTELGDALDLPVERGLCEPSIVRFRDTYFLTMRNDRKGYVTASADGLRFAPIKPWTFDDGGALGSYNTQQHWVAHSDALFLAYTRRSADNDNVFRHRAPLFMAQVDPVKLHVVRSTEKILMPNVGATYGNFGVASINENESWVTDAEGMFGDARKLGAAGRVQNARILWSTPNRP